MHRIYVTLSSVTVLALAAGCGSPPLSESQGGRGFVRYEAGGRVSYGLLEGDRIRRIDGDILGKWRTADETRSVADVKLLAPTHPTKIIALAGNYKSHMGDRPPHQVPQAFFKPPTAVIAHGEPIVIPHGTNDCHFEGELVIVIGTRAKNVPKEWAMQHVLGVTCGNDVSARDWQKGDVQWWRAKGCDTFAPCGPRIVSGINYDDLELVTRVNGIEKQRTRTKELLFGVAETVSFISRHVTLEPGDLIYTGTPGETSALKPGDVVEVEIEGIGILRNPVAGAP